MKTLELLKITKAADSHGTSIRRIRSLDLGMKRVN
jgi:hypothetical protein